MILRRPAGAAPASGPSTTDTRTAHGGRAAIAGAALAAVLALGAATAPAHAALFEDEEARRAILDLRARIETQNRELAFRLEDLAARLERLESASRGQLAIGNQLEAMRQDIARLRGEIEVQANDLSTSQRRQREQYGEIDARIRKFEPVTVTIDGQSVAVDQAERRAFDAALALFRSGDFRGALAAFGGFAAQYPQSPYGNQVTYWTGSAQYALKDWRAAATTLQALVTRAPNHPRVPDASLLLGAAQLEAGDAKAARRTWETLVERFPSSDPAAAARERLASTDAPGAPAAGSSSGGSSGSSSRGKR